MELNIVNGNFLYIRQALLILIILQLILYQLRMIQFYKTFI